MLDEMRAHAALHEILLGTAGVLDSGWTLSARANSELQG